VKKLIIFEFAEDARFFSGYCKEQGMDISVFTVLALQPEVKVFCKENGLGYVDTLPFFSNDSHRRALTASHRLTHLAQTELRFDLLAPVNSSCMNAFVYYYRFYLNNFTWILEVMKGIRDTRGDVEINVFDRGSRGNRGNIPGGPFLSQKDRFLETLIETFCEVNSIPFNRIGGGGGGNNAAVPVKVKESGFSRMAKRLAAVVFKRKLKRLAKSKVVFISVPTYHLDRVCEEIRAQFPGVRCVVDLHGSVSSLGYLKLCLKVFLGGYPKDLIPVPVEVFETRSPGEKSMILEGLKESFKAFLDTRAGELVYDNCSLKEELERKVIPDLLSHLVELHCWARAQGVFLELLKPRLVISPVSIGFYQAWAENGRAQGIPVVVIPQKGLVAPSDEYAQTEQHYIGRAQVTDDFAFAAAQSSLVWDYLKWSGYAGTMLKTGNLIFSRVDPAKRAEKRNLLVPGIGDNTRIIVYAPSMKSRKSRRFFVLETLDELLESLRDIIDLASVMEDIHLIVRIHPGEPVTRKQVEALLTIPRNVSVSDRGSFEEVLTAADLLISFSSTSIQEALINRVPVVLYDKWKRYNHLDAPRVGKEGPDEVSAAYYIDGPESLPQGIRGILEQHENKENIVECFDKYLLPGEGTSGFFDFVNECIK
jgi:hypothetical protein